MIERYKTNLDFQIERAEKQDRLGPLDALMLAALIGLAVSDCLDDDANDGTVENWQSYYERVHQDFLTEL